MTKTPISLQDLRRKIYTKAKSEPTWRFWGLYVHVCKMETLGEAYTLARRNNGSAGIDGVTFVDIEATIGRESFLEQIRDELVSLMEELGVEELPQDRLERMFQHYNENWRDYYGTDKTFVIE